MRSLRQRGSLRKWRVRCPLRASSRLTELLFFPAYLFFYGGIPLSLPIGDRNSSNSLSLQIKIQSSCAPQSDEFQSDVPCRTNLTESARLSGCVCFCLVVERNGLEREWSTCGRNCCRVQNLPASRSSFELSAQQMAPAGVIAHSSPHAGVIARSSLRTQADGRRQLSKSSPLRSRHAAPSATVSLLDVGILHERGTGAHDRAPDSSAVLWCRTVERGYRLAATGHLPCEARDCPTSRSLAK